MRAVEGRAARGRIEENPMTMQTPQPERAEGAEVTETEPKGSIKKWLIIVPLVVLAAIGMYFLLAAFLPRWWAQQIGDVVTGRFTVGTLVGLFVGFVFVLLPLLPLRMVFRRKTSWGGRAALIALAVVLAIPNLLTLVVVLGTGNGAHAGERIMDVEAPAFRGASVIGAVVAVSLFALVQFLVSSRRRARGRAADDRARSSEGERTPAT